MTRRLVRTIGLLILTLGACVSTPSGTAGPAGGGAYRATQPLTLNGFAATRDQAIDFSIVDRRGALPGTANPITTAILHNVRGDLITPPSSNPLVVHASLMAQPPGSRQFPWTVTLQPFSKTGPSWDLLPGDWIPQDSAARGVAASVGRIEIAVQALGGSRFITNTGPTGAPYFDTTFVAFDNDGVGLTAEAPTAWHAPTSAQVRDAAGVTIEWGDYPVATDAGTVFVHGVMCHPLGTGPTIDDASGSASYGTPTRTVILNHGALYPFDSIPCGSGLPYAGTLPRNGIMAGDLDVCVYLAQHRWRVAMSAYRNLAVLSRGVCGAPLGSLASFAAATPSFEHDVTDQSPTGYSEFCLGEVQDVLRWTDIISRRQDVLSNRILMIGGSHGGCVTLRAVEQGAPVRAAVALSSPTEFRRAWDEDRVWTQFPPPVHATNSVQFDQNWGAIYGPVTGGLPPPHALEVRSPARLAYPDITRRRDVPLLFAAALGDPIVHPDQACLLARVLQQHDPNGLSSHYVTGIHGVPSAPIIWGTMPPAGRSDLGQDCSTTAFPISWSAGTSEPDWSTHRYYFLLYEEGLTAPHYYSPFDTTGMPAMMTNGPIADFIAHFFDPMMP